MESRPQIHLVIIHFYHWNILQKSTKIDRLLKNVFDWDLDRLFKEFTVYVLMIYKSKILEAIRKQKFPKRYPPLNKDYVRFKKMNRMKQGFWQATGFSQVNLSYWRLKKGHYAIGFKKNLIHPWSGKKVYKIHNWVERGTSKMPARSLYKPIADSIRKSIYRDYFKKFIHDRHPEYEHLLD